MQKLPKINSSFINKYPVDFKHESIQSFSSFVLSSALAKERHSQKR